MWIWWTQAWQKRSKAPLLQGRGWGGAVPRHLKPPPPPVPPLKRRGGKMKNAGIPDNRIVFSEKFACPVGGFPISKIEPRLFSFTAPQGACPARDGLGEKLDFAPKLDVPKQP